MKRIDSFAVHTLLSVARQREGFDPERCRLVLEHIDTGASMHATLQRALAQHGISELQFAVLLVLFTLEPTPTGAAELAAYTAVSRSAITEALEHLEARQLVTRTRDAADRRIVSAQLTDAGRALIEPVTLEFLRTLDGVARLVDAGLCERLRRGYALLQLGNEDFQT